MATTTTMPGEPDGKERPKKFVRTFAGDMEALRKGAQPKLVQLTDISLEPTAPEPSPAPPPVTAGPIPLQKKDTSGSNAPELADEKGLPSLARTIPLPAPAKTPDPSTPPPPPPKQEEKAEPMPALRPETVPVAPESPPEPPPPPRPAPRPPAPSRQPKQAAPAPLQTYSSDFSDRVKETNATSTTILAAEEDAGTLPVTIDENEPRSRENIWYTIGSVVLIIIGGVGIYFAYARYLSNTSPITPTQVASAPIFVDDRATVSGTGTTLANAIMQSAGKSLAAGSIRLLSLSGTTTESVFAALDLPAPDLLRRNVSAAGSMAGIVSAGGTETPFFILSVDSYKNTFAGMLDWEPTMPRDLMTFFPPYPVTSTTTATSLTATVPAATAPVFSDEVVANHDARAYVDATGKTVLVYGYWDDRTLVIARNEAAFSEILQRIASSRTQ